MYSERFLAHFRRPHGQGGLDDATHTGAAVDRACGDELALDLRVADGVITDARFRARGCAGAIAVGSVLATLLPGREPRADAITREEIEAALGEVPAAKRHALRLALTALAAALASAQNSS